MKINLLEFHFEGCLEVIKTDKNKETHNSTLKAGVGKDSEILLKGNCPNINVRPRKHIFVLSFYKKQNKISIMHRKYIDNLSIFYRKCIDNLSKFLDNLYLYYTITSALASHACVRRFDSRGGDCLLLFAD